MDKQEHAPFTAHAERPEASFSALLAQVERVYYGHREVLELLLAALLAEGHVLIEDVPGVGKTTLLRAFARVLDLTFARVSFTPDLLPADLTGYIYLSPQGEAEFRRGPIFTQVLLADELNRASPRTQAALLEAMEERRVTLEGRTYPLPSPFFVLATQNPVELEGTYPLPEAELDRFLLRLRLGYPPPKAEQELLIREPLSPEELPVILNAEALSAHAARARAVYLSEAVAGYIVSLARKTREHPQVLLGVSPRGSLSLARLARAWAYLRGREFVLPEDVQQLLPYAWGHRVLVANDEEAEEKVVRTVFAEIVRSTPLPEERRRR